MTVPWFVAEARGLSQCYDTVADGPLGGGWKGYAYMAFRSVSPFEPSNVILTVLLLST